MRVLGSGCGATAFAFAQHHDVASGVARSENGDLRERWVPSLRTDMLAGVAFAHVRRPGTSAVDRQGGEVGDVAAARAEVILAVQRLTTVLLATVSGRGTVLDHPAQRLARGALFYVVQAQSADGKAATIRTLLSSARYGAT